MQALEEQFSREEGYEITKYDKFMFSEAVESEPYIQIIPQERYHDPIKGSLLVISLEPVAAKVFNHKINACMTIK